jgi:hypothetical protein
MSDAPSLVFLDDDCTAGGELIARHRAVLAVGHPVVSLGPILSPPGRRLRAWTHWDADRLQRKYERIWTGEVKPGWTHLYTGNVGIRRTDFLAVGGFDLRFARQEDIELGYRLHRLGCRFEFDPAAIVWHDSDRSLRTWIGIPSASARFDVLMDRLDPDSGRLAAMQDGLRDRHRVLRLTRRLVSGSMTGRCTVAAAIGAGLALHALRFDSVALAAFSVAWDLRYVDALQAATCPETAP